MKIAIPLANGQLSLHFGHCDEFILVDADETSKTIVSQTRYSSPPHEPGFLPRWLHEKGANVIIAGGMGQRAQALFAQNGISIVTGAESGAPEVVVEKFLNGTLQTGANLCDH